MMLEEKVSKELTLAETAKGIAPYLNVRFPEQPKEWKKCVRMMNAAYFLKSAIEGIHTAYLFCTSRKRWKEKKQDMKREREITESLVKSVEEENRKIFSGAGLKTQQEKDAWKVAQFTGLSLASFVKEKQGISHLHRLVFENVLDNCIQSGISGLESDYWVSIEGVEKPQIVNLDFKEKAKEWLLNEIYTRSSPEDNLKLLEKVYIWKDCYNGVCLMLLDFLKNNSR